jgi:hypothetical protein
MVLEAIQDIVVAQVSFGGIEAREIVVLTDRGCYKVSGEGVFQIADPPTGAESVIPEAFTGKRIKEVRYDGETMKVTVEGKLSFELFWVPFVNHLDIKFNS